LGPKGRVHWVGRWTLFGEGICQKQLGYIRGSKKEIWGKSEGVTNSKKLEFHSLGYSVVERKNHARGGAEGSKNARGNGGCRITACQISNMIKERGRTTRTMRKREGFLARYPKPREERPKRNIMEKKRKRARIHSGNSH